MNGDESSIGSVVEGILIKKDDIPAILGKRGCKIKQIQAQTGAYVEVVGQDEREPRIMIKGPREKGESAKLMLREFDVTAIKDDLRDSISVGVGYKGIGCLGLLTAMGIGDGSVRLETDQSTGRIHVIVGKEGNGSYEYNARQDTWMKLDIIHGGMMRKEEKEML